MEAQSRYALEINASELARLRRQNEAVGRESLGLLDRLGIQPGWRVADLGCGPMGQLEALSLKVGPTGSVVGVDASPVMVEQARSYVRAAGLTNVEVRVGDAGATGLPHGSFDLVHERLMLINVPNPEELLREMFSLVKPGGLVVLEDIDGVSWACHPPHPAWDRLYGAFYEVHRRKGSDPHLGRRLPGLLRDVGAVGVEASVLSSFHGIDHPWRHLLLQFTELSRGWAVSQGLLDEDEIDALKASLRAHLDDPHTALVSPLFVQAWGRRPS